MGEVPRARNTAQNTLTTWHADRLYGAMVIVVVCHLLPIRERNECKIDACVKPEIQTDMRLTLLCPLAFCSDCQ